MKSRKLVAGNWKMNLSKEEAQWLVSEITSMYSDEVKDNIPVVLFPPFPYLMMIASQMAGEPRLKTGAQNCALGKSGAFTGEVSAEILASCGVSYVLAGHSERRTLFGETDEIVAGKVKCILEAGLIPVLCCGESLAERESEVQFEVVKRQIDAVISSMDVSDFSKLIIAYEPVWAIGTGKTATSAQAGEMHTFIRKHLTGKFAEAANHTTILYGGSCNENNAAELFGTKDVDGGLIGGASLKSRSFVNIIRSFS